MLNIPKMLNGHGSAQILKNKTSTDKSFYHLLLPPPGDLPNPGVKPTSPALVGRFFTTEPPGKLLKIHSHFIKPVNLYNKDRDRKGQA